MIKFSHFLQTFPKVDLPVTLTTDLHHTFSQENKPFPQRMVQQFIDPVEGAADEFTEYIPCFRLPMAKNIHALVYWKAGLMLYEYILITYDKSGQMVDRKVIAGTKAEDQALVRSVATFKEDGTIYIVGGITESEDDNYDASSSQSIRMELLETGRIVALN
ncbi:MAG: hypothetical protein AAF990_15915 [Bacteroidota bacterium]